MILCREEVEYQTDLEGIEVTQKYAGYLNFPQDYSLLAAVALLSGLYTLNSPKSLLPLAKIVPKIKACV